MWFYVSLHDVQLFPVKAVIALTTKARYLSLPIILPSFNPFLSARNDRYLYLLHRLLQVPVRFLRAPTILDSLSIRTEHFMPCL